MLLFIIVLDAVERHVHWHVAPVTRNTRDVLANEIEQHFSDWKR